MERHLSKKSDLAALSGLRRPGGRLVLGLVALLAWPLLARLGAALLARPRLRSRLPALVALLLLALAHQFLLRLVPPRRSVPASGCTDYMTAPAGPIGP